ELSEREMDVLRLVAQGLSNKEIADGLKLSEHTVKTHLANILAKLHLRSRAHAAAYAVQAGLVRDVQPGR
ncbi:MAG TPA: helix-turn-helix transcriptional regulator, partial [Anaerolineae bacterium]|nr:helix-turn-helix transcriptional regulator [Anaerolineae bacterium]